MLIDFSAPLSVIVLLYFSWSGDDTILGDIQLINSKSIMPNDQRFIYQVRTLVEKLLMN